MKKRIGLYGTLVYLLLVWTIFQEFALGILYHFIHIPMLIKLIFFSKDFLLVLLYVAAVFKTKLPRLLTILQLFYIPVVIFGVVLSLITNRVSMLTAFSSARGLILLPAFITIGYSIQKNEEFISIIRIKYMKLLLFVAFTGIVEYVLDMMIGTRQFWIGFVQLGSYMTDIKNAGNVVINGLPANFYTYAANGAYTQKRLVSFWAHPLTSGYVLIIPFMYFFTNVVFKRNDKYKRKNIKYLCVVAIALFLTFTRGTIIPTLALVIICLLYRYRTDGTKVLLYISVMLSMVFLGVVFYHDKIFGYIYNGSTAAHLISLGSALKEVGLLGRGTGTFAAATAEGVWTESAYVSIAGQLGIVAVLLYLTIFLFPIWKILKKHKKLDLLLVSIGLAGVVFFFTGIISEQLCAYTAIAPYYILVGVALRSVQKGNQLDRIDNQVVIGN